MKVHHLNCGSMREIEPVDGVGAPLPAVCHCLLVETPEHGLVLIESGIGSADVREPELRLGADWVALAGPALDPAETALSQIRGLGHAPEDVRHIVLTHLDLDHAGGLGDFPDALVHVHENEHAAGTTATGPDLFRYRPAQWAHGPKWRTYSSTSGERWFGFDAVRALDGLPPEIVLVPLAGHTRGHTAVAVRTGEQGGPEWLLHAGDAYYYHRELDPTDPHEHPMMAILAESNEVDHDLRLGNLARLRDLARWHEDDVDIVCAHDPWDLARWTSLESSTATATRRC